MSNEELAGFIQSVSGRDMLAVEEDLGSGFVRLRTAEAERRQAKHDIRCVEDIVIEMLRNARDAHAHTIYVATGKSDSMRRLTIIDDGDGIPPEMQDRIFEPRVTSKLETMVMDKWGVHGRGMALYSIRSNAASARVLCSDASLGSSFDVEVDLDRIGERSDQSTYPQLADGEDGVVVASGPHNIVRTIVEFALESKNKVSVYYGTPTDITSALVAHGRKQLEDKQLLFCDDVEELPICLRPAAAVDAADLVEICAALGLDISERTAHRVLAGQIEPAAAPLRQVTARKQRASAHAADIYKDSRGLKISDDDLSRFTRELEGVFDGLARQYYVQLSGRPKVRVGKDCITVKFPIDKEL